MKEKSVQAGWRRVKFGEVVRLSKARCKDPRADGVERFVGLEHLEPGDLRIRSWGNVADGVTFTSVFKPGQVLFGKRRAYQRKVAVADFTGVCSGDIYVLETLDANVLLPELLPFICQTDAFFDHAVGTSAGSLSPRTNWSSLANFEFVLPPMSEQRRILDGLASSYALIESYQDLIAACNQLWKSRTADLFGNDSASEIALLGGLVDYSSDGPFGSKLKTEHYSDQGARVVRLNNIDLLEFDDADSAFVTLDYFQELRRGYEVKGGDIIIAGLGDDRIPMGRACIVPMNFGPAINKADCYCLRTNEKLSARYLVHFLNSNEGLKQARSLAQGTTRKRLNLSNIRRFGIPFRLRVEQEAIADELDAYRSARKQAINRLKSSIAVRDRMRELAFSGEALV